MCLVMVGFGVWVFLCGLIDLGSEKSVSEAASGQPVAFPTSPGWPALLVSGAGVLVKGARKSLV